MSISRRHFLRVSAAAALATGQPLRAQTAGPATSPARPFEVAASLYPWDLHDEGVEKVLDNVQQMSAVNCVYLVGLMHPERRPQAPNNFPHNPARQSWMAEDARAYWKPDLKRYGRIKPRLSENDWLNQTDWMKTLADAARKRGLRLGMEFSHALCDKIRVEGEFADVAGRDIHGDFSHTRDWLRPLCPNHPDTRELAVALFSEVVGMYDLDFVQSCIISMDEAVGGSPARGGCFCASCKKAAASASLDLDKIQKGLLANPAAQPELGQWQKLRYDSVAAFYELLSATVHKVKPTVDLRYNMHMKNPRDWGVDLVTLKPHIGSLRIMDYSEQQGTVAALNDKRAWLTQVRKDLGPEFPLNSAVAVRPRATPELIRQGTAITVETKMNGISLGHYDSADFAMLRAIREGLIAANIPIAPATTNP